VEAASRSGRALDDDIGHGRRAFEVALRAGDAATASEIYAEEATLIAPATGLVQGRTSIERYWRYGLDAGVRDVQLVALDLRRSGDVAVEIGEYALHLASEVDGTVVDRGRYLTVLRMDPDGRWRRTAEMLSPDARSVSSASTTDVENLAAG
jgi:ketosteroid isomerase-like protein